MSFLKKVFVSGALVYVGGMLGTAVHVLPFAVMAGATFHEFMWALIIWPTKLAEILVSFLT